MDEVTVRVSGGTVVDPERVGLAFGDGAPGPVVDVSHTFAVDRTGPALPSTAPGTRWQLWRLAAPLPTILPSYNQIGFDSLHYLVTLVEFDGESGVGWVMGATADAEPDPATRSTFPVRITAADGGLHLKADGGMTLEAMGAVLAFDDVRITARLDAAGSAPDGATLAVSATCGDIPLYGSFLRTLGFCNPDTDQLHVFGGAWFDARPAATPVDVGEVTLDTSAGTVAASFTPSEDLTGRSLAVLVLDAADGSPVALDYGTGTQVSTEGAVVTVTVPAADLPPSIRVWVLVDGYPAGVVGG